MECVGFSTQANSVACFGCARFGGHAGVSADVRHQHDIAYTLVVSNPTVLLSANYSLSDAPGFDSNVNIVAASFTRNGGSATALTGAGPWTLQSQWRALAAGASDTYVLTVRININRAGSIANDICASPSAAGFGLHNNATATLQGLLANTTFNASACRNTPTPVWVTLRKQLVARAVVTDQVQIRLFSGGNLNTAATTTGSGTPATASTGLVVLADGNTVQFEEAVKANGTGSDQLPSNYSAVLACTNATSGSTTVLPSGSGVAVGTRRQWAEFQPVGGDDLDCVITNDPTTADLQITKTNTPGAGTADQASDSVTRGAIAAYEIVVRNAGPASANNAVLRDTATGLGNCVLGTPACAASGGASCASAGNGAGQLSSANLLGAGVQIPLFPAGGVVTVKVSCTVQ